MASKSQWAFRITLSYRGRAVKLESAVKLEMIAPPSVHLEGAKPESGSWFALEDAQGRPIYRRPMGNPFSGIREMLGGTDREFSQVKVPVTKGTIELLIPDLPETKTVSIWASEAEGDKAHQPARRMAQVSMTDVAAAASQNRKDHGRK